MTTHSNSIPTTSIPTINRKWTIVAGVALGVGALAASVVQDESASARQDDPAAAYAELAPIVEWAEAQGLSGLSPASLRPVAD
jgi:hypothetical protein